MKAKAALVAVLILVGMSVPKWAEADPAAPQSAVMDLQPLDLVDAPTAGLLPRGGFQADVDVYSDGGLLVGLRVGFARYFMFGISYGGLNVIGSGDPQMNPEPAVQVKARLIEESLAVPAVAIGFDSQGYGSYFDDESRYLVKSRGVFAVASKNWDILGPLSLHGGINYSLENEDDNDLTIFIGLLKSLGGFLDVRAEYDFAYNDNEGDSPIVEDTGYLNAALVWHVNERFCLSFQVRDIMSGDKLETDDLREWNRGLTITYHDFL